MDTSFTLVEVEIDVTQEHIEQGKRSNCAACPIALAITDMVKDFVLVRVGAHEVRFGAANPDGYYSAIEVSLPLEAQAFIRDYDKGELKLSPTLIALSFKLPIPQGFIMNEELAYQRWSGKIL